MVGEQRGRSACGTEHPPYRFWCTSHIGLAWNARRWAPPMRAPHGLVTVGIWEGRCADPLQTAPYLSTLVGVECQALNAAHKGTPRTGYRRDVERGC